MTNKKIQPDVNFFSGSFFPPGKKNTNQTKTKQTNKQQNQDGLDSFKGKIQELQV